MSSSFAASQAALHLFFFGVFAPWRAFRNRHARANAAARGDLKRIRYPQAAATQSMLGVMSVATALLNKVPLLPAVAPDTSSIALGALAFVLMVVVGTMHLRRRLAERDAFVLSWMPVTRRETLQWCAFSLLIGLTEEIIWRGVQVALLTRLLGSVPVAVVFCAVTFGFAHLAQGWRWAIAVIGFAFVFHALVFMSGALYVAIVVHAAVDASMGVVGYRLGQHRPDLLTGPPRAPAGPSMP